jgi:hypothetical protein
MAPKTVLNALSGTGRQSHQAPFLAFQATISTGWTAQGAGFRQIATGLRQTLDEGRPRPLPLVFVPTCSMPTETMPCRNR